MSILLEFFYDNKDLQEDGMIRIDDRKTGYIFDPWGHIGPKRRRLLDESWAGLYREHILPHLPVEKLARHFKADFGRPTKELHTALSAVFLQQMFDLTDEETVTELAFHESWHYALDLSGESDEDKYLSPKTLWTMRKLVTDENLDGAIFESITSRLAEVFSVKTDLQRLDSVHVKSNMRRLGRLGLFSATIRQFLVNLRRKHPSLFAELDEGLRERYLSKRAPGCFSMVKPSEAEAKLAEAAADLGELVERFRDRKETKVMSSFQSALRLFYEQCVLRDLPDGGAVVEVIPAGEVSSDSLQNPSDPDAGYSGHKGQGYSAQVMETYAEIEDERESAATLNLITHVEVTPACVGDASAVVPALVSVSERDLAPSRLTADSLYGSDENCEAAAGKGVALVSPVMGTEKGLSLSDFEMTESGEVTACPAGHAPKRCSMHAGRYTVVFALALCEACPQRSECPVKRGRDRYELRFNGKKLRLARRRRAERMPTFREKYRWRAGAEATMSELDRKTGLKHLRIRGHPAVRLCAKLKAAGVNIFRAARVLAVMLAKRRADGRIMHPTPPLAPVFGVIEAPPGALRAGMSRFARRAIDFFLQPRAGHLGARNPLEVAA